MIEYYEERFDSNEETAAECCNRMAVRGWEVVQIRNHSVVFKRDTERIERREENPVAILRRAYEEAGHEVDGESFDAVEKVLDEPVTDGGFQISSEMAEEIQPAIDDHNRLVDLRKRAEEVAGRVLNAYAEAPKPIFEDPEITEGGQG